MTTRARLDTLVRDIKSLADAAEARPGGPTDADLDRLNKMSSEVEGLATIVKAGAGKFAGVSMADLASSPGDGAPVTKAPGRGAPPLYVSDDDVKAFTGAALDRHAMTKVVGTTQAPQAGVGAYDYRPVTYGFDRTRIMDLLPVERTEAPSVYYFRETTAAAAAAAVAEGVAKPESSPVWTQVQAIIRKYAHWASVTDEVLSDLPSARAFISESMVNGLVDAENTAILTGSGTAPAVVGLNNTTGVLTRAKGADTTLDAIIKGMNDLRVGAAFASPDLVILNPTDWTTVRTLKSSDGSYLLGDPTNPTAEQLFGVRVALTAKQTLGTALILNTSGVRIYLRQPATFEVAPAGGGEASFINNTTLVRAETRFAVAVPRPASVLKLTGI